MTEINETLKVVEEAVKWVVGIGGGLAVIWGWIAKPLRDVKKEVASFEKEMKSQMMDLRENMQNLQGTTDFMLGDRLAQAHTYWTKKRYCPPADKERLVEMHKVYSQRGLNHLYESYEEDILDLPDVEPR